MSITPSFHSYMRAVDPGFRKADDLTHHS
jgi:hypothetical protein